MWFPEWCLKWCCSEVEASNGELQAEALLPFVGGQGGGATSQV